MKRRRMFQTYKAAIEAGDYTELPELPAVVDPQVYLSRNSVPQPFYLICGKDTVVAQMSGEAVMYLKDSSVNSFKLAPGDNVYVPAGTPHRIVPLSVSVQLRYKAPSAGMEGVAWFCDACGRELARAEWDTSVVVPQRGYLDACTAFNADQPKRTCRGCGTEHPAIDLGPFSSWHDVAAALEEERAAQAEKSARLSTPA
jgi:hypothetical protein